MSYLINLLSELMTWLQSLLLEFPLYILQLLLNGLADFINWLPVPSFVSSAAGYISSLPAFPAFLLQGIQIAPGFVIVITAYTVRFLIRRIPFFG